MNEHKKKFIYEQQIQLMIQKIKSMIDYIYTDQETIFYNLMKAAIKDTRELLNTDHKIIYTLLNITE